MVSSENGIQMSSLNFQSRVPRAAKTVVALVAMVVLISVAIVCHRNIRNDLVYPGNELSVTEMVSGSPPARQEGGQRRRLRQAGRSEQLFPDEGPWNSKRYIFVGGLLSSGAFNAERLLDYQKGISGININNLHTFLPNKCLHDVNGYCAAPDQDGSFLTSEFKQICTQKTKNSTACEPLCIVCNERIWYPFEHAQNLRLTEADATAQGAKAVQSMRRNLYMDWSRYWDYSTNAYFVEKDPENLIRGRYLQAVFGGKRTAFIYVMKHPLASQRCQGLDCSDDLDKYLNDWLSYHEMMAKDVEHINNYIVFTDEAFQRPNWEGTEKVLSKFLKYKGGTMKFAQQPPPNPEHFPRKGPPVERVAEEDDENYEEERGPYIHAPIPEEYVSHFLYNDVSRQKIVDGYSAIMNILEEENNFTNARWEYIDEHPDEEVKQRRRLVGQAAPIATASAKAGERQLRREPTLAMWVHNRTLVRPEHEATLLKYEKRLQAFGYGIRMLKSQCVNFVFKQNGSL